MSRLRFSRALKRSICIEYMQSGKSRKEIALKYDLPSAPMDVAAMSALIEAQRKQIEKLEKQLKYSQDKNLALNTLIDVIEEQGIKVRKKAGVKQ